jgi:hypothetical protein
MLPERYLAAGLTGLGRCADAIWEAHFAAAVLAGFYYAANNQLSTETERNLQSQLDQLIAAKRGLFEPEAKGGIIADPGAPIVDALAESIDRFSELGHNSIFSAYALRAMRDLGGTGRERTALNIASVVRQIASGPAHYWLRIGKGHDPRKFTLKERVVFPDEIASEAVARVILAELPKFKNIYTQMGSKSHVGHLLTQSQSLLALRDLGYAPLANRGFYSLECRFTLLKDSQDHTSSPVSFYRLATRSAYLPTEPEFWTQDFARCEWDEGHTFKYTFSFYELTNRVPGQDRPSAATEKFRFLVSPNERSTAT